MKVIILCGGRGARFGNDSDYIPKAMVNLGHRPLVWHVMKRYALEGFNEFILALGTKGTLIKDYFIKYKEYANDIQVHLGSGEVENLAQHQEANWKITLVDTGDSAMTGARIARCKQYIKDKEFMVAYADCLADVDINKLLRFHRKSKRIATIIGVNPPYREGEFLVKDNLAIGAYDKRKIQESVYSRLFNGGYMVFKKEIFSYLNSFNECKLETDVFSQLTANQQLAVYPHNGFWCWLDTDRDYLYLSELVDKNKLYWLQ